MIQLKSKFIIILFVLFLPLFSQLYAYFTVSSEIGSFSPTSLRNPSQTSILEKKQKMGLNTYNFNFSYLGVLNNKKTILILGFLYTQYNFTYSVPNDLNNPTNLSKLDSLKFQFLFSQEIKNSIRISSFFDYGFYTDKIQFQLKESNNDSKDISDYYFNQKKYKKNTAHNDNGQRFTGGVMVQNTYKGFLEYGAGLGYVNFLGDFRIIPLARLAMNTKKIKIEIILPRKAELVYVIHPFMVGVLGETDGNVFKISNQDTRTEQFKFAMIDFGPLLRFKPKEFFIINLNFGLAFYKSYVLEDTNHEVIHNYQFNKSYFVKLNGRLIF